MIHVLTICAIAGGCTYIGMRAAARLKWRETIVFAMRSEIRQMMMWMEYSPKPLVELAAHCKSAQTELFWDQFTDILRTNRCDVPTAWAEAMRHAQTHHTGFSAMNAGDLKLLQDFAQTLGASGRDTQRKQAALFDESFQNAVACAQADYAQKGKLYRSIGILCGVAFAILLW